MKKKQDDFVPEWSHPVEAETIGRKSIDLTLIPDEAARAALARRLSIVSLDSLTAEVTLKRNAGNMVVHVSGHIKAAITQECVVTLEPLHNEIDEKFEGWYADPAQAVSLAKIRHDKEANKTKAEKPVLDESEDPEAIVNGIIDIGELITQYLSLYIDPYPRKPGAQYADLEKDKRRSEEAAEIRKNPFAALKDWKSRQE